MRRKKAVKTSSCENKIVDSLCLKKVKPWKWKSFKKESLVGSQPKIIHDNRLGKRDCRAAIIDSLAQIFRYEFWVDWAVVVDEASTRRCKFWQGQFRESNVPRKLWNSVCLVVEIKQESQLYE